MSFILAFMATARVSSRSRADTALEVLALRQQVAVLKRRRPRPPLSALDRLFWTVLRETWARWQDVLVIVKPETVVKWHRAGSTCTGVGSPGRAVAGRLRQRDFIAALGRPPASLHVAASRIEHGRGPVVKLPHHMARIKQPRPGIFSNPEDGAVATELNSTVDGDSS